MLRGQSLVGGVSHHHVRDDVEFRLGGLRHHSLLAVPAVSLGAVRKLGLGLRR